MRGWVVALCLAMATPSWASSAQDERARALYAEGKAQFDAERYPDAYERFKEAYALSPLAPLLFNMAAALQAMNRPGEAAEKLRAYVRVTPDDPNRGTIEARARGLEEAQRQLDVERARVEQPRLLELSRVEKRSNRRALAIGLGVGGAVIVGLAIGLGVYFGTPVHYPSSSLGTQRGTP